MYLWEFNNYWLMMFRMILKVQIQDKNWATWLIRNRARAQDQPQM